MTEGFFPESSLLEKKESISTLPQCESCGLYKKCFTPKMAISGMGKRKVLVIGEAPGENEDREGVQFVGKAGEKLIQHLENIGVSLRSDCWITNANICRPP